MNTAHLIHIPLDNFIDPQTPKTRETLPNGGRAISDFLLVGDGPIDTLHAVNPLVDGYPLMNRGYSSDFGERF
jgi:hypothetical protein